MPRLALRINGHEQTVETDADTPLLYVLRDDLHLRGPKFGCGLGQCGACSVLVDGVAMRSCLLPASDAVGKAITTLEGLGTSDNLGKVQAAFLAERAAQCGYCANGMIIATQALLTRVAKPSEAQIRDELATNLCRCGTHDRIVRAAMRAAEGA